MQDAHIYTMGVMKPVTITPVRLVTVHTRTQRLICLAELLEKHLQLQKKEVWIESLGTKQSGIFQHSYTPLPLKSTVKGKPSESRCSLGSAAFSFWQMLHKLSACKLQACVLPSLCPQFVTSRVSPSHDLWRAGRTITLHPVCGQACLSHVTCMDPELRPNLSLPRPASGQVAYMDTPHLSIEGAAVSPWKAQVTPLCRATPLLALQNLRCPTSQWPRWWGSARAQQRRSC